MNGQEFFESGQNRLSCMCTVPDDQPIKAGVVFVHAADGNRLGPHRMFVELASKLRMLGIASIRFDMRGCGDSSGKPAGGDINPDIEDLLNAISFFKTKYELPQIYLFGISRGARVSISAIASNIIPIDGAILLSTPFSGSKAAVKKFSSRLKEYLYKFTNPDSLKKIIKGRINFKQILKTLAVALNTSKRYGDDKDDFVTVCPMFFIYGSKDPIASDSTVYYRKICEKFGIPFKMTEINSANHSFFHYRWKQQIIDMTEHWLLENICKGKQNG